MNRRTDLRADPPVRVAILGGGAVTRVLHLPALRRTAAALAVAVVDPDRGAADYLRAIGYEGEVLTATWEDFLADRKELERLSLDAVVVALPNALHEAAALRALECGLHVLCEKPLALSVAACRRLAEAADGVGRVLAVGMVRRLPPGTTALREALADDLIGPVRRVDIEDGEPFHWRPASAAAFRPENGGVLADMGVHYLDLLQDLFGPLRPVRYRDDWGGGCEANCEYELATAAGVAVRMHLSRDSWLPNEAEFTGDRGRLVLQKDNLAACVWKPAGRNYEGRLTPKQAFANPAWPPELVSCFAQQYWEFARAVRGACPVRATADQAAEVASLVEWAYAERAERVPVSAVAASGPREPQLPPGPAVVTGGTGFIGGRLLGRLAGLGCQPLVVPMRSYLTCVEAARFPVTLARVDLLDRDAVRQAVRGARYVFHLAYGRDGGNPSRVTVAGTRNVVEAAIEAGAESVVVLSTMYVFGHPETDEEVDETWPYAPAGGVYGRSKARMERWCLRRAADAGRTRIVVLNPSCVYGPGGKTYTRMPAEMAKQGAFCWVEGGRGTANYCYVDNLVDAVVRAAGSGPAHGRRIVINDGWCSWRDFLRPLLGARAEGLPSYTGDELRRLSQGLAKAGLRDLLRVAAATPELIDVVNRMPVAGRVKRGLMQMFPRLKPALQAPPPLESTNGRPPGAAVPPDWLGDLFGPTRTRFGARLARQLLGWEPRVGLAEGQARTTHWLQEIGVLEVSHLDKELGPRR